MPFGGLYWIQKRGGSLKSGAYDLRNTKQGFLSGCTKQYAKINLFGPNRQKEKIMADVKKELVEVAVLKPFPAFTGKRTDTDKRCFAGREAEIPTGAKKKDGTPIMKPGKTIPTQNKVRIQLPVPENDEQAKEFYGVDLSALVAMGARQAAYTLNKTDAYLTDIGDREVDVEGLTKLVEGDMPRQERVRKISEVKEKAGKYDALKAKFGLSDEELEAAISLAKSKNLLKKK